MNGPAKLRQPTLRVLSLFLAGGLSCYFGVKPATSQETKAEEKQTSQATKDQAAEQKAPAQNDTPREKMPEGRGALVVVPLPISSPALGSGIVPVLAYIFPLGGTDPFYSKDFGKLGWEYAKALVKQLKRDKVICNE